MKTKPSTMVAVGYDGTPLQEGDRIEMHPATDPWMQGARFGTVRSICPQRHPDHKGQVRVELDHFPAHLLKVWDENVRKITTPATTQGVIPYQPKGEDILDERAPLTPQERDLAESFFRLIRHAAAAVNYDYEHPSLPTASGIVIRFDEARPRAARVTVEYFTREFSSSHAEIGVAADMATALSRMSDDDDTNGSHLLDVEVK